MATVLSPIRVGSLDLPNRVIMAPMTRLRAGRLGVPSAFNATYYAQRASAGLIITEATDISPQATGYAGAPGIWSDEQVAGWRLVTDAVHARGGRIFLQIWHTGRVSHPSLQPDGALPVAPSAVAPPGNATTWTGQQPLVTPRALELQEIPGIVAQFGHGARNARHAGFDGVEVHGANGYLIDQFLRDAANQRTDAYGGSVLNRARFLFEVLDAIIGVWGSDRVSLRLSPVTEVYGQKDTDPVGTYRIIAHELNRFALAFLEVRAPVGSEVLPVMRRTFRGPIAVNQGLTLDVANALIANGEADLASFARPCIGNPDLVERFAEGAPLAESDPKTWYGGTAVGYTDYPALTLAETALPESSRPASDT
jgi:N-ethylmaleimide reductase